MPEASAVDTPAGRESAGSQVAGRGQAASLSDGLAGARHSEPLHLGLSGWGCYPVESCRLYEPADINELCTLIRSGRERTYIARGLGRAYGDAALNREHAAVSLLRLDRILSFDAASGILECEGGASLDRIIRYALPRGFFLPVTPGTRHVTAGGAIAADVHGKNHHQAGSFSNFVLDLDLLTAEGQLLMCSRERQPDVFGATAGGMGLTGFITRARIQLRPVESAYLRVRLEKVQSLAEALTALEAGDREYEYSAAWMDCLSRGARLGRAVVMLARHATRAELAARLDSALAPAAARHWRVPFTLPVTPLRQWTVRLFNGAYFGLKPAEVERLMGIDPFFYPLDFVENWNRLYGRSGFVQYQIVVPHVAAESLLTELLGRIHQSGRAAFLGVLKRFGPGGGGMLSFPLEGVTLALDLPFEPKLPQLLRAMDERVADHGGRVYLAKDAVLSPASFARMYPRLDEFRSIKERLDPEGRLSSSLARRLKIVNA